MHVAKLEEVAAEKVKEAVDLRQIVELEEASATKANEGAAVATAPVWPPAPRSATSSVVTPPLSILITGHKQGTMWFLGLIQKVIESDERMVLCPPREDGGHRHSVGGMS